MRHPSEQVRKGYGWQKSLHLLDNVQDHSILL